MIHSTGAAAALAVVAVSGSPAAGDAQDCRSARPAGWSVVGAEEGASLERSGAGWRVRAGRAPSGLTQTVPAPADEATLAISGAASGGEVAAVLKWTLASRRTVSGLRALAWPQERPRSDRLRVPPVERALSLQVSVLQMRSTHSVRIRRISLRAGGRELLANPRLDNKCHPQVGVLPSAAAGRLPGSVWLGAAGAAAVTVALLWWMGRRRRPGRPSGA